MEINDLNKKGFSNLMQIIFLALLIIAICAMIFTVITLIKNKNIIISDPLIYGMKVHNFTKCSCLDSDGKFWDSEGKGFISKNYNN